MVVSSFTPMDIRTRTAHGMFQYLEDYLPFRAVFFRWMADLLEEIVLGYGIEVMILESSVATQAYHTVGYPVWWWHGWGYSDL